MNIIKSFINNNRREIIIAIIIVAFIFIITPILNEIGKQTEERKVEEDKTIPLTEEEENLPTKSIIGGSQVAISQTKKNVKIIEQFVEKCNNQDITGAYNMLTEGCKQALYETEEIFKNKYYDLYFETRKLVDMENYLYVNNRYTYYVTLYDDILSTGKTGNVNAFKDYITIDNTENGKLSIKNLIYRKIINKTVEIDGIQITVLAQEIYKDNEKYQIEVKNKTQKTILIDTKANTDTIYLITEDDITYESNIIDVSMSMQKVEPNNSKTYKIKFNKPYSVQTKSKGLAFLDIVPDYEKYMKNKKEVKERVQIAIEI